MTEDMSLYFSGKELYGDDFDAAKITAWARDEKEGYAELGAKTRENYVYPYHALNTIHGFEHIKFLKITRALGLGSAYGDEFEPIAVTVSEISILDPSEAFSGKAEINGTPVFRYKPNDHGTMPFENGSFELITVFGVLHHIANVSYVMSECYRCLKPGGVMLVREPIVSMGDWTKPRRGLTKRERGIPLQIFYRIIRNTGFSVRCGTLCIFPPISKLGGVFGVSVYNSRILTYLDGILSRMFSWNIEYHRVRLIDKFAPAAIFFVLDKQGSVLAASESETRARPG